MYLTIITDCHDANARGRQETRAQLLFSVSPTFIGIHNDIEAAGNLLDVLAVAGDAPGVILLNVAPRGGHTRQWENGTPFGYLWYQNTLIVGTIDGLCFSLLKKCTDETTINVLDISAVTPQLHTELSLSPAEAAAMATTQFRSLDFLPRAARYLYTHRELPHEPLALSSLPDAPAAVWWVDNFGNCKTTLTERDIAGKTTLTTRFGTFPIYPQLKAVPDQTTAVTIGSSGLLGQKFVELVTQRASTAAMFTIKTGDQLEQTSNESLQVW